MAESPIVVGEHSVCGIPHERVTERDLALARISARLAALQDLALAQEVHGLVERPLADERPRAPVPEALTEHAARAQDAPRMGIEPLEA